MGIKIDLPLNSIEEASLLESVLSAAKDSREARAQLIHATPEERERYNCEAVTLGILRDRLMESSA